MSASDRAHSYTDAFNAGLEAAAQECEFEARACQPGSAADDQNWGFAFTTLATVIRKLKRANDLAETRPVTKEQWDHVRPSGPSGGDWNAAIEAAANVCTEYTKRMDLIQARTAGNTSSFLDHKIRELRRDTATTSPIEKEKPCS